MATGTARSLATLIFGACNFATSVPSSNPPTVDAPADAIEAPACFEQRCRKKRITIDHTKVAGDLARFPLFVQLADPDLANARPTGADFAFVAADGITPLAHERERFANNELFAWVAVPALSATVDTTLFLYYGDAAAADTQNATAVWDGDFQAVWHLAGTASGNAAVRDSTTKLNHGTDLGVAIDQDGKLAKAVRFDGIDDHIRIPIASSLTMTAGLATLGMWVKWTQPVNTTFQRLLMSTNTFNNDNRGMEWATNPIGEYYYYPSDASGANAVKVAAPFASGTWHHIVVTQDYSTKTVRMYLDGAPLTLAVDGTATNWLNLTTAAEWHWGGIPDRARFAGMMDEIRVSKIVRSAAWIATEYANQSSPATFYTVE